MALLIAGGLLQVWASVNQLMAANTPEAKAAANADLDARWQSASATLLPYLPTARARLEALAAAAKIGAQPVDPTKTA